MRLIDADKCPCITCTDDRNAHCTYEHRSCDKFCKWINTIAYDKEKVVEQLEEIKSKNSFFGSDYLIDRAIEIVEKGGAE